MKLLQVIELYTYNEFCDVNYTSIKLFKKKKKGRGERGRFWNALCQRRGEAAPPGRMQTPPNGPPPRAVHLAELSPKDLHFSL